MRDLQTLFVSVVAACAGAGAVGCGATRTSARDAGAAPEDAKDTANTPVDAADEGDVDETPMDVAPDADAALDAAPDVVDTGCDPEFVPNTCSGDPQLRFRCGLPVGLLPGMHSDHPVCREYCERAGIFPGFYFGECRVVDATAGAPATIFCRVSCPVDGRRPEGYAPPPRDPSHSELQAWLVASAAIEHASVTAFLHLARELEAHGAPASLVARALTAADDERCHTAWKCALARRHGAAAKLPAVALPALRDLATLARENAVEGCVRETWGALLATWQGAHASDASAAAVLTAIAADETRHAQLAWDVDAWARTVLPPADTSDVAAARGAAVVALHGEALGTRDPELREAFGAPDPRTAARMLAALQPALWDGEPV